MTGLVPCPLPHEGRPVPTRQGPTTKAKATKAAWWISRSGNGRSSVSIKWRWQSHLRAWHPELAAAWRLATIRRNGYERHAQINLWTWSDGVVQRYRRGRVRPRDPVRNG